MSNIYLPKLVTQKYDEAMDYHITMYDNLPYKRDPDFCGEKQIGMYSGHIIKYYLCLNEPEAFEVDNRDDEIEDILSAVQEQESRQQQNAARPGRIARKTKKESSRITQEQIQTLLQDDEQPDIDDNLAPEGSVNAFEGVEDW